MITAEDLAKEIHITGRAMRGWLRKNVSGHRHYERWEFSRVEADRLKREYLAR